MDHTDPYFDGDCRIVSECDATTNQIEEEARRAQDSWHHWQKDEKRKLSVPRNNWSGMTIRELAKEVGLESHYNAFYRLASLRVHPHVLAANDH